MNIRHALGVDSQKANLRPLNALVAGVMLPAVAAYVTLLLAALRQPAMGPTVMSLTLFLPGLVALGGFCRQALRTGSYRPVGYAGVSLLAGGLGGAVLGIGLRIGMRMVALLAGKQPVFTVSGTLFVLIVTAGFGLAPALVYAVLRPRLPHRRTVSMLLFGTALAAYFWYLFFRAAAEDLRSIFHPVAIALFTTLLSSLWILYAVIVELALERYGNLLPNEQVSFRSL